MTSQQKYRIVQTVATGGTAVLYKAIQTSLDRTVALKRLHPHLTGDENFTRRFVLEAKAAAGLDHENIVHVIDFGETDGSYEIIMEFVEGRSLKEILGNRERLPYEVALAIAHQVCRGLEHAHAKGIVHRDIKPGNILVTHHGKVKITDFGLAKLTQGTSQNTAPDSLLGTPLYMSPEQAYGESVDGRSDLFSLGTMLYEMITGKQPFFSDSCMGVINNIIRCRVDPPSLLVDDLPPEVERIVMKALNKNREGRFQSAGEFRRAIEDFLGLEGFKEAEEKISGLTLDTSRTMILGNTPSPVLRKRKRRRLAAALGVVFILLSAGIAATEFGMVPDGWMRELAVLSGGPPGGSGEGEWELLAASGFEDPRIIIPDSIFPAPDRAGDSLLHGDTATTSSSQPVQAAASTAAAADTGAGVSAQGEAHTGEAGDVGGAQTTREKKEEPSSGRKSRPRVGWLSVSAEPWAEIYIDGRYVSDTPPAESLELPAGYHTLQCKNPRFETYTEELYITAGELSRRHIKLKKLTGRIRVFTQPGVQFFVDGRLAGITPLQDPVEVEVGRHLLVLKKNGFHDWYSEVEIEAGKTLSLRIRLSPSFQSQ